MKAELLLRERFVLAQNAFPELVIWKLPEPLAGSTHRLKYRLALIVKGTCVLRYDNEVSKGDHRHVGRSEAPYAFQDFETLIEDFWADVEQRLRKK
jgi:hypothetical protein